MAGSCGAANFPARSAGPSAGSLGPCPAWQTRRRPEQRRRSQLRVGPRTVVYRGQGLRFSILGGSYRFVVRGTGIALSSVGWGWVTLEGQPKFLGDDTGVYSVDGVDCSSEPQSCTALPETPLRVKLGALVPDGAAKSTIGEK